MSSLTQDTIRRFSANHQAHIDARNRNLQSDKDSTRKEKLTAILSAGFLGFVFDYFFNGHRLGISVTIFSLLLIAAVHLAFRGFRQALLSTFLLAASIMLCISYGVFNNGSLRFLNGLAIPLGVTAYVLSARYGAWNKLYLSSFGTLFSKLVPHSLETAPKLIAFSAAELSVKPSGKGSETRVQILRGLIIAAPLLVVIMMLLTSSDAVFSRILTDRFTFLKDLQFDRIISHTLLTGITAFYFFGYLWSLKYEYPNENSPLKVSRNLESVSAITVLALLCVVYLLFTIVQFTYLYSASASLPAGLTYAGYARRGFFELLAATFVNIAAILVLSAKSKDSSPGLNRVLFIGNSLLTLFTLNLLISAFYRMHLYEGAYGFTELRLFVQFFMAFLAVSLVALLVWIWKREFPLLKIVLIAAVTVYLALNYVNVDRLIAHNNLERYLLTHQIDTYHLGRLSVDAWPEINAASLDPIIKKRLTNNFLANQRPSKTDHDKWFEYNYHQDRFLMMQP